MKLYEKIIDGKQHIMPAKKIIIKKMVFTNQYKLIKIIKDSNRKIWQQ